MVKPPKIETFCYVTKESSTAGRWPPKWIDDWISERIWIRNRLPSKQRSITELLTYGNRLGCVVIIQEKAVIKDILFAGMMVRFAGWIRMMGKWVCMPHYHPVREDVHMHIQHGICQQQQINRQKQQNEYFYIFAKKADHLCWQIYTAIRLFKIILRKRI